jgi:hypothetical protein
VPMACLCCDGLFDLCVGISLATPTFARFDALRMGCPEMVWGEKRVFPVEMTVLRWGKENGSRVARMPTHAMRPHEWGTRLFGDPNLRAVWRAQDGVPRDGLGREAGFSGRNDRV